MVKTRSAKDNPAYEASEGIVVFWINTTVTFESMSIAGATVVWYLEISDFKVDSENWLTLNVLRSATTWFLVKPCVTSCWGVVYSPNTMARSIRSGSEPNFSLSKVLNDTIEYKAPFANGVYTRVVMSLLAATVFIVSTTAVFLIADWIKLYVLTELLKTSNPKRIWVSVTFGY